MYNIMGTTKFVSWTIKIHSMLHRDVTSVVTHMLPEVSMQKTNRVSSIPIVGVANSAPLVVMGGVSR